MNDHDFSGELDALIAQLDEIDDAAAAPAATPIRLIVATDWSDAAVPLTLLRAFRAIVPSSLPVQLAFAVPHEPTQHDAELVHVLLEGLDDPVDLAGLEVVSFDEAGSQTYDSAVVPTRDPGRLIAEVGGMIVRMHDLVRRLDRSDGDGTINAGDLGALRTRLGAFAV